MARALTARRLALAALSVSCSQGSSEAPGPAPEPPGWQAAASTHIPRESSATALLADGRVLVMSGHRLFPLTTDLDPALPELTAEVYDPATDTWTPTPQMGSGHMDGLPARLDDGRILVAGGAPRVSGSEVEIFDPETWTWTPGPQMSRGRQAFTLTQLSDGRYLAAGGIDWDSEEALRLVEFFDPDAGSWTRTDDLPEPRFGHFAAAVGKRVMLLRGWPDLDLAGSGLSTTAVYDEAMGAWNPGPEVPPAANGAAVLLRDGRVLLAGGRGPGPDDDDRAFLVDVLAGTVEPTDSMTTPRALYTLTELPDGRVLAAGGAATVEQILASAEIWDPATGLWTAIAPMARTRDQHAAVLLQTGEVLIIGGYAHHPTIQALDACEIYRP